MRKILAIIWKDTLVRFAGWMEWLFFLVLPIVFTVVLGGGTGPSADARIRLVVVDQAHSPLAEQLLTMLARSEVVRPELLSLGQAEKELSQRRVSAVLILPLELDLARLQQGLIELELRQQPNNMNAMVAGRAVGAVIGRIGSAVQIANASVAEAERIRPFASDAERQAYWDDALQEAQELTNEEASSALIKVSEGVTQDQVEYDPRANSSAGQLITWVFVPLIGISGLFAYERQQGTLRRVLTSSTSRWTYLLGTLLGQVATALVQMLLLVSFGMLVMKLNWGHSPVALAAILVASALAGAGLGVMLGTFVKSEGQASGLSIMLGMVMALLGGCWYPIELFPQFVRTAVKVLPTSWAMQGMLDIVLRSQGLAGVLPEAGALLGFAALFLLIGVWRFRYE